MDLAEALPAPRAGFVTRVLFKVAAVDFETMKLCPPKDWDNARAIGEIMIGSALYQTALFTLLGHRLFAPDGFRLHLLFSSTFISFLILLIDSHIIIRAGWFTAGLQELLRGGLDVTGGFGARMKAGVFLAIRILLSVCLAQLTAVFLSLLIFNADVSKQMDDVYLRANGPLIATATAQTDATIQRATEAVTNQNGQVQALAAQVTALRQTDVDPAAGDAQVQEAQHELNDALAAKAKADDALQATHSFASGELGGVAGPGHSGVPGNGVRHKAALEAVADARSRVAAANGDVVAARARLDGLHHALTASGNATRQNAHDQLPGFDQALAAEVSRLDGLKQQLDALTQGRSEAIRTAVESAPDHVARDIGLLAQVAALERIANSDRKIAAVIILIDVISFSFELGAILARAANVPTTYAALLARDAYLQAVRIVDGMMAVLGEDGEGPDEGNIEAPIAPAASFGSGFADMPPNDPFGEPPPAPPKRPRGRPRKTTLN